jgi:hypothetical protein
MSIKDMHNQHEALHREYRQALEALRGLADDFTDGSQQRFMDAMRQVNALRDEVWYTQQQMYAMDNDECDHELTPDGTCAKCGIWMIPPDERPMYGHEDDPDGVS